MHSQGVLRLGPTESPILKLLAVMGRWSGSKHPCCDCTEILLHCLLVLPSGSRLKVVTGGSGVTTVYPVSSSRSLEPFGTAMLVGR